MDGFVQLLPQKPQFPDCSQDDAPLVDSHVLDRLAQQHPTSRRQSGRNRVALLPVGRFVKCGFAAKRDYTLGDLSFWPNRVASVARSMWISGQSSTATRV